MSSSKSVLIRCENKPSGWMVLQLSIRRQGRVFRRVQNPHQPGNHVVGALLRNTTKEIFKYYIAQAQTTNWTTAVLSDSYRNCNLRLPSSSVWRHVVWCERLGTTHSCLILPSRCFRQRRWYLTSKVPDVSLQKTAIFRVTAMITLNVTKTDYGWWHTMQEALDRLNVLVGDFFVLLRQSESSRESFYCGKPFRLLPDTLGFLRTSHGRWAEPVLRRLGDMRRA